MHRIEAAEFWTFWIKFSACSLFNNLRNSPPIFKFFALIDSVTVEVGLVARYRINYI